MNYVYITDADFDDVVTFYRNVSYCSSEVVNLALICSGDAEPFGSYSTLIREQPSDGTMIIIDITWDKCSTDWVESIE